VINPRTVKWEGHVTRIGEEKKLGYGIFVDLGVNRIIIAGWMSKKQDRGVLVGFLR